MTTRAYPSADALENLLVVHFRPVAAGGDLARRALERLRDDWDPGRFASRIRIEASGRGIRLVRPDGRALPSASGAARRMAERAREELHDYLGGRRAFFSVPVDVSGTRPFQRKVLELTRRIPFGETRSYGWIARRIGHPGAVRAVGTALGHNPVPILVPCHRVLRGDGGLGGYAFGLDLKTRLLDLERTTPVLEGCATTGIVCRVGCPDAMRMREDSRVVFASVEDARSVGYRACRICRPAAAAGA
jgi:O-6-methylguanine DNA methyltransferase